MEAQSELPIKLGWGEREKKEGVGGGGGGNTPNILWSPETQQVGLDTGGNWTS